jgi:hypothetical protein
MAVIVEVCHADGTRTRHAIDGQPLTIGRALANDLVLDDPYVDARHARIARDENGALFIEDLGSVNGVVSENARQRGVLPLPIGGEVRVGRTTIRFRDSEEPLAPALVDEPAPAPARAPDPVALPRTDLLGRLLATTRGRLTIIVATVTLFGLYSWLGTSARSSASDVTSTVMGFAMLIALWAAIWAVASRIVVHRAHFISHLAIAAAFTLAALGLTISGDWLSFFFPDFFLGSTLTVLISLGLFAALIAWHLSLSSTMSRRRQWRVGFIVAGTLLAIGGLAALTEEDSFSVVPKFSSAVKPVAAEWVPTSSIAEFDEVMKKLKTEVDGMAKK